MKCPYCGSENTGSSKCCNHCGKEMRSAYLHFDRNRIGAEDPNLKSRYAPAPKEEIDKSVAIELVKKLRGDYNLIGRGSESKILAGLGAILLHNQERRGTLRSVLEEVGKLIYRYSEVKEVSIGIKNPADGRFRYEVMIGFRKEVEEAHKKISYSFEDFFDKERYQGEKISKYSEVFLAENQPFADKELSTYNRPVLIGRERKIADQYIEGDYIDIVMYGRNDEVVGWIELSATRTGKMPSAETIRWIELIASVLGIIVQSDMMRRR